MNEVAQVSTNDTAPTVPPEPSPYLSNGVQALRTAQRITLALSQMADQKASILMGATFLVFSLSVSRALDGHLPWSLAVLAVFAFLSAILAVLAVMPSLSRSDGIESEPNLLFFGHFATMDEETWTLAVLERLKSDEALYRTMLHDMYQNGQVLFRRKYRYLGYAYRTFMVGLVMTLGAFAVELATGD